MSNSPAAARLVTQHSAAHVTARITDDRLGEFLDGYLRFLNRGRSEPSLEHHEGRDSTHAKSLVKAIRSGKRNIYPPVWALVIAALD